MCVSCGCGDPDTRHIAGDIVLEDLVQAARNHEIPVDQVIANIDAMRGQVPGNGSKTGQGATQTQGARE
ncbi:MAG: hypothetical protein JWM18_1236 [Chloroflexi bacterium]|jgi:hypothetical protein|nr:hypothetical protein [Chloroflexota bacterium]